MKNQTIKFSNRLNVHGRGSITLAGCIFRFLPANQMAPYYGIAGAL